MPWLTPGWQTLVARKLPLEDDVADEVLERHAVAQKHGERYRRIYMAS